MKKIFGILFIIVFIVLTILFSLAMRDEKMEIVAFFIFQLCTAIVFHIAVNFISEND